MAQQVIGIGSRANDGTGDLLRDAFDKINQNFDEIYGGQSDPSGFTAQAAASAAAAATSEQNAANSATAAANSATDAAASVSAVSTYAGNASASASAASTSEGNAAASAALAQQWATQTNAEVQVGQGFGAKKYANDAANSATAAAASQTAAANSATAASTSATDAANSAAAAASSAADAAASSGWKRFATRSALAAANLGAGDTFVELGGYYNEGDVGEGAKYTTIGAVAGGPGDITTANGVRLNLIVTEEIDLGHYGLVVNGATSDAPTNDAAFQNAYNAATSAGLSTVTILIPGGVIWRQSFTLCETSSLACRWKGAGMFNTTLKTVPATDTTRFACTASQMTWEDIGFVGPFNPGVFEPTSTTGAILINNLDGATVPIHDFIITRCYFTLHVGYPIQVVGGGGGTQPGPGLGVSNVNITECRFLNNKRGDIDFFKGVANYSVVNCIFSQSGFAIGIDDATAGDSTAATSNPCVNGLIALNLFLNVGNGYVGPGEAAVGASAPKGLTIVDNVFIGTGLGPYGGTSMYDILINNGQDGWNRAENVLIDGCRSKGGSFPFLFASGTPELTISNTTVSDCYVQAAGVGGTPSAFVFTDDAAVGPRGTSYPMGVVVINGTTTNFTGEVANSRLSNAFHFGGMAAGGIVELGFNRFTNVTPEYNPNLVSLAPQLRQALIIDRKSFAPFLQFRLNGLNTAQVSSPAVNQLAFSDSLGNTRFGMDSVGALYAGAPSVGAPGPGYFNAQVGYLVNGNALGAISSATTSANGSSTVTITNATPGIVSWAAHGLSPGTVVNFTNAGGGTLPTGIVAGTNYYVCAGATFTANSFAVAATATDALNGNAIATSGGSGTVTCISNAKMTTAVATTIASLALGAGIFDVTGAGSFSVGSTTVDILDTFGITTIDNQLPDGWDRAANGYGSGKTGGQTTYLVAPTKRIIGPAKVFAVAFGSFTTNSMNCAGMIRATRVG